MLHTRVHVSIQHDKTNLGLLPSLILLCFCLIKGRLSVPVILNQYPSCVVQSHVHFINRHVRSRIDVNALREIQICYFIVEVRKLRVSLGCVKRIRFKIHWNGSLLLDCVCSVANSIAMHNFYVGIYNLRPCHTRQFFLATCNATQRRFKLPFNTSSLQNIPTAGHTYPNLRCKLQEKIASCVSA